MSWSAFYAPMKSPRHPVPSGDRRIARLLLAALDRAGLAPRLVSELRTLDLEGCATEEARLAALAEAETARLCAALRSDPPALWFSYHCHYKAPDLVGPSVAHALGIPYVLAEPSISPKRRAGPHAAFAEASETAIAAADRLFWTTERDRPALEAAGHGPRLRHLPAFLEPGARVLPRDASAPLRLLTVAMMRPGDKAESYRRLAAGLGRLAGSWQLSVIGSGPAEAEVRACLAAFGSRATVTPAIEDDARLRAAYEAADLLLWPGVGEGVGMVWLEAQAAGLPVVAEDGPAARALVAEAPAGGLLAEPDDPDAFAAAVTAAARDRARLSAQASQRVRARHSLDAAARRLAAELIPLAGRTAA